MSARLMLLAALATAPVFSGCSTSERVFSAEREDGRVAALDWRIGDQISASRWNPDKDPNPPLSQKDALAVANASLFRFVKKTDRWSLAYCKIIEFQPGCYGWSVRFDRQGVFEDAQASDRFVKFYVLFDKSVIVPAVTYGN